MNIVVLGGNGQLGNELKVLAPCYPDDTFIFTDIDELDISDPVNLEYFIKHSQCEVLINAAAYTAVDKAETESAKAYAINTDAVKQLALLSVKYRFFLLHLSTDYVFDGSHYKPYVETDIPRPLSVYGNTKLEGEKAILAKAKHTAIVRTSWLYSSYGNNFVKTMLRLGSERSEIKVVCDQIGSPTYAGDLAKVVLQLAANHENIQKVEIYHYANEGIASWYDFAKEILHHTHPQCVVLPISGKDYPTLATRPYYSVLSKEKIKKDLSIHIPYWKDSLQLCLEKLCTL
ncbi:MAG: dTDP-4-dehydrorhamnose reductase [Bacteroidales bacterium]|nr:dTDP-4-dehydrorhamnose reductase [Bacteroidales bacterium]